jgi:hypothetical protein
MPLVSESDGHPWIAIKKVSLAGDLRGQTVPSCQPMSFRALIPIVACLVSTVVVGCGSQATTPTAATAGDTSNLTTSTAADGLSSPPCGRQPAGSVSYLHVIWLWMENKSYDTVIGSDSTPYLNELARQCGLATSYYSIAHPSLPNYIAATSGLQGPAALEKFRSDCEPGPGCRTSAKSIFEQTPMWRAYEEGMPEPCYKQDSGKYAVRHNPPTYYTSLSDCVGKDVESDQLNVDLDHDSLPAFSFLTPNVCSDSHDCSIGFADEWLSSQVSKILGSPAYRSGETVLFVTYDEGEGQDPHYCSEVRDAPSCHVATVVVSPSTPAGTRSAKRFDHYSLLRTTEDLLGLPPLGGAASAASMAPAFGLGN